jgi:hypothetical protein
MVPFFPLPSLPPLIPPSFPLIRSLGGNPLSGLKEWAQPAEQVRHTRHSPDQYSTHLIHLYTDCGFPRSCDHVHRPH